jgi:dephospho-CoA kinase
MSYVVGLTGGIGCGKSTVAELFRQLGADIIDADAVSHDLTRKNEAGWRAIREVFGPAFFTPDGELDRAALRSAVFSAPPRRKHLESLLHPLIRDETARRLAECTAPYVLVMVPLLLEGGRQPERYRRILVIDCQVSTQVDRVVARSGMDPNQVRAIIGVQIERSQRLKLADDVIDNDGPQATLSSAARRLDRLYRGLAAQ